LYNNFPNPISKDTIPKVAKGISFHMSADANANLRALTGSGQCYNETWDEFLNKIIVMNSLERTQ